MLRLRPIRVIAWLCLLLQLGGAALAFETVLCVASDGHVALETAHAGTCEAEARRHHEADHDAGLGAPCNGHPCTDIALGETAGRALSRAGDDVVATPALVGLVPPPAVATPAAQPLLTRATAGSEARLVARRTVVLRN
ncbi:MAG: hypothetical protein KIT14_10010 [bacterium]|nr:hypothetical protein [bacterium]